MCFIITPTVDAAETLLINAPLRTANGQHQLFQLCYINSINPVAGAAPTAPLMIVPIPNPHAMSEDDFTLFEVDKERSVALRRAVNNLNENYAYVPPMIQQRGFYAAAAGGFGSSAMLAVHRVGSYNITVAPNFADLAGRAPWDKFGIAQGHLTRVLTDMQARFPTNYAFVVAEGVAGATIDQGGFGVVYRDSTTASNCFFPTSHEVQPDGKPVAKMDVVCVGLGAIIDGSTCAEAPQPASLKLVPRTTGVQLHVNAGVAIPATTVEHAVAQTGTITLRGEDACCSSLEHNDRFTHVSRILANLPKRGAAVYSNTYVQPMPVKLVTSMVMDGLHANTNLRGRLATDADVRLVDQLYQDVDLWLEKKQSMVEESFAAAAPFGGGGSGGGGGFGSGGGGGFGSGGGGFGGGGGGLFGAAAQPADRSEEAKQLVSFQGKAKLDVALALLARQLATPGAPDRVCDADKVNCGPTTYLNLDMPNTDLCLDAYRRRDATTAKSFPGTYLRVSSVLATWEPLEDRRIELKLDEHTVTKNGMWCDICRAALPVQSNVYSNREVDYDECAACHGEDSAVRAVRAAIGRA